MLFQERPISSTHFAFAFSVTCIKLLSLYSILQYQIEKMKINCLGSTGILGVDARRSGLGAISRHHRVDGLVALCARERYWLCTRDTKCNMAARSAHHGLPNVSVQK